MENKFSVILSMIGKIKDRFAEYGKDCSMEDTIEWVSKIKGVKGLELVYPYQFRNPEKLKTTLITNQLVCSTVNVNLKTDEKYHRGSLTNINKNTRNSAINDIKKAMDLASEFGCNLITICPLADGHDYPFEVNYLRAWKWLVEGIAETAEYRKDVRISLEYKKNETRTHVILDSAGTTLHLCNLINLPNVGVTFDIGHSLYTGETPAQIVSLLSEENRLFLVHVNDNYRDSDWDLIPGSINFWDWIEVLFYLNQFKYSGWLTSDVFPARQDSAKVVLSTYESIENARNILNRFDKKELHQLINKEIFPDTFQFLTRNLINQ